MGSIYYHRDHFHIIKIENGFKKVSLEDGTEGYIHAPRVVEYTGYDGIIDEPNGPVEGSEEGDQ
jgi:hypothetical protein